MGEGNRAEARRSRRIPANLQMELLLTSQYGKVRQKVTIVDMSLLGVRIRSIGSLVQGQMVTLVPSEASINVYPCQVMWTVNSGIQFYSEAGLEFQAMARKASENKLKGCLA